MPSRVRKAVSQFYSFAGFNDDQMLEGLPANLQLQLDLALAEAASPTLVVNTNDTVAT